MMEQNMIKENLLRLIEGTELDINIIRDFQKSHPTTPESLTTMSKIVKAKLGALQFKVMEYTVRFKTYCNLLQSEFGINLPNSLTKNQLDIYNEQLLGDMIVIKNDKIEFNTAIPEMSDLLNSLSNGEEKKN